MQAGPDTNINKKKNLMVTKSVLKEKKKQLEKKREGMGSFALGTILSIRDKGVGVRARTFKVFFFFLQKRICIEICIFFCFSPKVGLLKSAEYASPDSNELGVIVHVVVVHTYSTRHFDPVKVFTYTTTLFTLFLFFLWSLNHVVKKKLREKRNEYLSHYSQF